MTCDYEDHYLPLNMGKILFWKGISKGKYYIQGSQMAVKKKKLQSTEIQFLELMTHLPAYSILKLVTKFSVFLSFFDHDKWYL